MKTSLSRMLVLGVVGWVGVMTGVGCSKTDVGDPAACRAAEAYLPTWSKEHTSAGHSAITNVRCEEFTSNVAAGSAETTIRFDEDITGIGRSTVAARFTSRKPTAAGRSRWRTSRSVAPWRAAADYRFPYSAKTKSLD